MALLAVLGLHWSFVTSRSVLALLDVDVPQLLAALDLFSITIFLVFTTVLVIRGLAWARFFPGIEQVQQGNGSTVDAEQVSVVRQRLEAFMRSDRPHLIASLSLDDLASRLSLPSWQLSRVINTAFEQNFFHFINSYRVNEARVQLADPAHNHKTMLQILHESGFNSKSTFNDAFKRHTGMTPSQYRTRAQRSVARAAERHDPGAGRPVECARAVTDAAVMSPG
jgi:AraC-like DNA-binding protein